MSESAVSGVVRGPVGLPPRIDVTLYYTSRWYFGTQGPVSQIPPTLELGRKGTRSRLGLGPARVHTNQSTESNLFETIYLKLFIHSFKLVVRVGPGPEAPVETIGRDVGGVDPIMDSKLNSGAVFIR